MENTATPPTAFVFAATDRAGKRLYVESAGQNAAAARYRLEIQGFTDIDVVKDAFDARLDRAIASDAFDGMTLHEKVEFQRRCAGLDGDRFVAWQSIKNEAITMLCLTAWVWWRASGARPWSAGSLIAYVFALGYIFLLVRVRMPARLYDRLIEARAWHRWDAVSAAVEKIRAWRWFTGSAIPEFELLFAEARVLAGRGQLAAALEKVKPLETDATFDRTLYLGSLASLYELAQDLPGCIAVGEEALALDPQSPTARIDLAYTLAISADDRPRACALLAELDPADVQPMAQPYLEAIRGVMALDEGRAAEAEEHLAKAREGWRAFMGNPLAKGFARTLQGYHAAALRRLGQEEKASEEFEEVRAFLEATDDRDVLRRY